MLDFIEKGGDLRRLPHLNPSADKLFKPTPTGPAPGHPVDSSNIKGICALRQLSSSHMCQVQVISIGLSTHSWPAQPQSISSALILLSNQQLIEHVFWILANSCSGERDGA
eukprot:COSAG02_NODE_45861_length_353_cov_1.200787_1_plen_111_part_00